LTMFNRTRERRIRRRRRRRKLTDDRRDRTDCVAY
jgi:hypothetical protein